MNKVVKQVNISVPITKGVREICTCEPTTPPRRAPNPIREALVKAEALPAISPTGISAAVFRFGIINMKLERTIASIGIKIQKFGTPLPNKVITRSIEEPKLRNSEAERKTCLMP